MPSYEVRTPQAAYSVLVEWGALGRTASLIPARTGRVFVITEERIWRHHGSRLTAGFSCPPEVLYFPGGEDRKRLATVEQLAEQMVAREADRTSLILAFGGGIVGDVAGFLAAGFMRGIPVIQAPTTLLAQVDAAVGGKTGVNLASGKNLFGAFHQPLAVLIDPQTLTTLPEREYRAGLFEVIKHGVIRSPELFELMRRRIQDVFARQPEVVERMISESVRLKSEVVSADEREADLRRILNFGHTFGHALEAETGFVRFLHGEAVGFGMQAAAELACRAGYLDRAACDLIRAVVDEYGPIPSLAGIDPDRLIALMASDKKTLQGRVHFVLPEAIGRVRVVTGIDPALVRASIQAALG
jgi:3-dehydroquinate synthase